MNAHVAHKIEDRARRLISVDDLRRMIDAGIIDDEERVELIDGELIEMAAKKARHELVKSALIRRLTRATGEDIYVGVEASIRLDAYSMPEPDILVCRRGDLVVSEEGYLRMGAGSALLVIEVSDSTIHYDRGRKAALYANHGLPEYWVVDVNDRKVWVHSEPSSEGYRSVKPFAEAEELAPAALELAGLSLKLADLE